MGRSYKYSGSNHWVLRCKFGKVLQIYWFKPLVIASDVIAIIIDIVFIIVYVVIVVKNLGIAFAGDYTPSYSLYYFWFKGCYYVIVINVVIVITVVKIIIVIIALLLLLLMLLLLLLLSLLFLVVNILVLLKIWA